MVQSFCSGRERGGRVVHSLHQTRGDGDSVGPLARRAATERPAAAVKDGTSPKPRAALSLMPHDTVIEADAIVAPPPPRRRRRRRLLWAGLATAFVVATSTFAYRYFA